MSLILLFTGYDPKTVDVPVGNITVTSHVPTIRVTQDVFVEVPHTTLTISSYSPTIETTKDNFIDIPRANITITAHKPTVIQHSNAITTNCSLTKIPTLGIGFGVLSTAVLGLNYCENIPPVLTNCGSICCSIIVGNYGLGCSPITSQFDINYSCAPIHIPDVVPPQSGGGGGSYTYSGFYVPFVANKKECNRTIMVVVKLDSDKVWRKLYAVNTCESEYKAIVGNVSSIEHKPTINVEYISHQTRQVSVSIKDDK